VYMWSEGMEELQFVCETFSKKFIALNDENFIIGQNSLQNGP